MILAVTILIGIGIVWVGYATLLMNRQRVTFRQAFVLTPVALARRLDASVLRATHGETRIVYVVAHESRLDPALMLSLLPEDTLHILDEYSAKAMWLEPWRELARTITFNAEHVFVSRRLVRVLRGGGKLCVYMPAEAEQNTRAFRLYRAVARIALRAEAKVMPINVAGSEHGLLSKMTVQAMPPATIDALIAQSPVEGTRPSTALYDRMQKTRAMADTSN
jgi:acyl-[acyl-carrier-protein]-phospholipid O-acyltransferase/long-chain-fatty-acid--[acyl-carrier-protein] ligase